MIETVIEIRSDERLGKSLHMRNVGTYFDVRVPVLSTQSILTIQVNLSMITIFVVGACHGTSRRDRQDGDSRVPDDHGMGRNISRSFSFVEPRVVVGC